MTPSFTLTLNSSFQESLNLGLKLGVTHENGEVASIGINNLSRNMTEMDITMGIGKRLRGHEATLQLCAQISRSKIEFYQSIFEYVNTNNWKRAENFTLSRWGFCHSMGLSRNWGTHFVSMGAEGLEPIKFDIKWNHSIHKYLEESII